MVPDAHDDDFADGTLARLAEAYVADHVTLWAQVEGRSHLGLTVPAVQLFEQQFSHVDSALALNRHLP